MTGERPYAWEKSYPPGVKWDSPLSLTTIPALFDKAVAAHANRPALEYRGRSFTYGELGELVNRAAAGFAALGVAGAQVALYAPNTPLYVVAFFGALKAGARIVNLSPLDAERELAHKLRDSGARTLVTTTVGDLPKMARTLLGASLLDHLLVGDDCVRAAPTAAAADDPRVLPFQTLLDEPRRFAPVPVGTDEIALLQYTGGTTGTPRAAMLTHGNLTAAVSSYDVWSSGQKLLRPGEERVICVLPLFHIYALTTIMLRHLSLGNELLLRPRFDAATTIRDIQEKRATIFPGVPTMWIGLMAHPGVEACDFSSLRHCTSGGAALPVHVAERFAKIIGRHLGGGWGMTETSPAGTNIPSYGPRKPGSVGIPLPGVHMDVVALDDARRVLQPGDVGEIRVKGLNVTRGYWRRPQETKDAFVDGHLLTGDIGYMDEDGFFFLVDRKKEMIISGGFNVYPRVIEEAIYEHPSVEEVLVIGVPDDYRGEAAKAFVKLRAGAPPLTLDDLRDFLADKVGRHELPTALEIRDSLPRSTVGKLSKRELLAGERPRSPAPN